ncbi:hypothetical protein J3459_006614 [Metarhizium acridum]|nr:hypothetical protein J3459_006614 [Metarhizium acridum]
MQARQIDPTAAQVARRTSNQIVEIPPEKITVAILCALAEESVAVRYGLDEKLSCTYKTIGPKNYVYSFGRIGDHNVVLARPSQMGPISAALCAATVNQQFPNVRFALVVGIGAGIPNVPKRDIGLGDICDRGLDIRAWNKFVFS